MGEAGSLGLGPPPHQGPQAHWREQNEVASNSFLGEEWSRGEEDKNFNVIKDQRRAETVGTAQTSGTELTAGSSGPVEAAGERASGGAAGSHTGSQGLDVHLCQVQDLAPYVVTGDYLNPQIQADPPGRSYAP